MSIETWISTYAYAVWLLLCLLQVEQHKLQTEKDSEELVGASNGERVSSANDNQVSYCFYLLCESPLVKISDIITYISIPWCSFSEVMM